MIGQNPKTSLSYTNDRADEMADITALLQSLPRVSAPTDFNASLKARIAAATAEEKEFAAVTAMIKELPRVAAPSDFDFRLRARIAQAKAEQEKVAAGWLSALFGQSFSWLQASAAMAAVALVVSVVTWGTLRSSNSSNPVDTNTAQVTTPVQPAPNTEMAAVAKTPVEETKQEISRPTVINNAAAPRAPRVKAMHATAAPLPEISSANARLESEEPAGATRTVIIKHRSGEARVVNLSEYNLGLQTASLRTAPASKQPETTLSANIY